MPEFLARLIVAIVNLLFGGYKQASEQQEAGEIATETEIKNAANERAKGARKNAENISSLPDDELDERMRRNRAVYAKSQAGSKKN